MSTSHAGLVQRGAASQPKVYSKAKTEDDLEASPSHSLSETDGDSKQLPVNKPHSKPSKI